VILPEGLAVELIRVLEFENPIAMAVRPGSGDRQPELYVAAKTGRVARVATAGGALTVDETTLDVGDRLSSGNEQGLLGMTFSPAGERLYLDYTDRSGTTNIVEWSLDDSGRPDPSSERTVLQVPQPARNHNAGAIVFGPDGYLYVTLGDGGGAGDRYRNGQDRETLLGSILRISPERGEPYAVPADNPFVSGGGRPEIWMYGLRNPWRISFDSFTGDLWIADVGQNSVEEVNVAYASTGLGAGANLGWPLVEGSRGYEASSPPADHLAPIHEYGHDPGCSVTGGHVYRGDAIAELWGVYVFSDYCAGTIWGLASSEDQGVLGVVELLGDIGGARVASFGEGPDGELYVLALNQSAVYRIDPSG
jgi:glucose/arabinose dehydrogenase